VSRHKEESSDEDWIHHWKVESTSDEEDDWEESEPL
jgi:hypothetical protein